MRPPPRRKTSSRATAISSDVAVALAPRRATTARRHHRTVSAWLFLLPSAAVLGAVLLFPLGYAIYLSLFNYDLGAGIYQFIGAGNYAALLGEQRFWQSLLRTVLIVLSAVALEF